MQNATKKREKYWTGTTIRTVMCSVCLVCVDVSSLSACSHRKTAHCLWISGSEYFLQLGKNACAWSGVWVHAIQLTVSRTRSSVDSNSVTSSWLERTMLWNPSCLPTGAVESPRPSICLARKIHSGEVSIHPMTWAEDSREPMPWLPCPFGHGSLPFPEVDDDIEARAETAARTHVVTDPRWLHPAVEIGARRTWVDNDDDDSPFSVTAALALRVVHEWRRTGPQVRDVALHRARPRTSASQPMCRRTITSVTSRVLTAKQLTHTHSRLGLPTR